MTDAVSVSIVTWNHASCIERCLTSLLRQTHPPLEIVVADNGSTDGTLEILERFADRIRLRRNGDNLGFCGGHNPTIRESRGGFILLANPDAEFDPNYLAEALRTFEKDPAIGTVCGVLYREPGILDGAGLALGRNRQFTLIGHGQADSTLPPGDFEVFGADGAAPMYRRALAETLSVDGQFFDEMFFAHKEDHDVSWRARLAGWKTVCARRCVAIHPRNFRPNDLSRRKEMHPLTRRNAVKNFFLVMMKNDDALSLLRDALWWLPRQLLIFGYLLLRERDSLSAYGYIIRNRKRILATRRQVQRLRKATRSDVDAWYGRTIVPL
jgi:GT2 family glycosyltransferase